MKRLLIVLLFLIIPFLQPTSTFAQPVTTVTTEDQTTTPATVAPEESLWSKFWDWISSVFIKTDYIIAQRQTTDINSDMTDYGNASDNDKHSSSGTRLTDSNNQTCYKGNVIKKVILETTGYSDSDLSYICPESNSCSIKPLTSTEDTSSCQKITINNLAHYFIQTQKQFYCDDKNKLINTESNVINKVNEKYSDSISSDYLDCYQTIYNDFYLVPKETSDENEENSKNIVQTPISASDQKSGSVSDTKNQLDQNFSPDGTSAGLNGLRPASW